MMPICDKTRFYSIMTRGLSRLAPAAALALAASASLAAQPEALIAPLAPPAPDMRQIAIESLVVELSEDGTRQLGMRFTYRRDPDNNSDNTLRATDLNFPPSLTPVSVPRVIDTDTGIGILRESRLPGVGIGFLGIDVGPGTIFGTLRMLLTTGNATVRTHPIILAANHTPAVIETVEEVPFQDISYAVNGEPFLDVKYEKVGVRLNVTPTILDPERQIVELDITQIQVSSVKGFVTIQQVNRPIFAESTANTKARVKSGHTLIIGGLKTQRDVLREERIPIIGRIPVLGFLFKSQKKISEVKDTLFFITPHILDLSENPTLPADFSRRLPDYLEKNNPPATTEPTTSAP